MKWIDQAGYACAAGWSGQYCVTVYVGGIRFYKPILIGSMVEIKARVIYTGQTSMHIAVDVSASDPRENLYSKTTHCIIIFVAIDQQGKPSPVRQWQPQSPEDLALEQYARKLMSLRTEIENEMQAYQLSEPAGQP